MDQVRNALERGLSCAKSLHCSTAKQDREAIEAALVLIDTSLTEEDRAKAYYKERTYNLKRARIGSSIINTNERLNGHTNTLADVLADLIHYAAEGGVDFNAALEAARLTWHRSVK